jgi:signal transduction histidine kinase
MLSLIPLLLVITAVVNLSLISYVYTQSRTSPINRSFALFALFIACWALLILSFLTVSSDALAVLFLKLSYVSAVLIAACLYYFSLVFPAGARPGYRQVAFMAVPTVTLCAALFFPSFLTGAVVHQPWGREVILNLTDYLLFSAVFCMLFLGGLLRMWRKYRAAEGLVRKQLLAIASTVTVIGLLGIYYNLVLPSPFFEDFRYVWTGPICTAVFALVITYAIFRYKLFDTKAFIAEVLVYAQWLVLVVRTFTAATQAEQLSNGLVLTASIPIGILLLRSIQLEVRAREQLAAANDKLIELDRLKSQFLSIASHQLRGPVSVIRNYVSLLKEGSYGILPLEAQEPLERLAFSSGGLATVIEDYLNISRIEQGRMQYRIENVDLRPIVERTVRELEPTALAKALKLSFVADGQVPYLAKLDAEKMKQVVFNLLDNAIKYTPRGSIVVCLSRDADRKTLLLSIQDTGAGIDQETMPRLFERFSRGADASAANSGGSGLGLYVVRQLVEAQGGRVWAESKGKGFGSTFFVEVPELQRSTALGS